MRVVQRSFPSETETFGNAVVEAQAAGLPVIVAPGRAPSENVREGRSPWRRPFVLCLPATPCARMGLAAARFAHARYHVDDACQRTFAIYRDILAAREAIAGSPDDRGLPAASNRRTRSLLSAAMGLGGRS